MKQLRLRWMGDLAERLRGRRFLRNVLVLLTGTALGQALTLLASPLLTRLYAPEAFGALAVYGGVLYLVMPFASLSTQLAIPIARSEAEAVNLTALCLLYLAGVASAVGAALLLAPDRLLDLAALGAIAPYRILVPFGIAAFGLYSIAATYATRVGEFAALARTRIVQGIAGPVAQITLALLGAGTFGLILGSVIGQSSGALRLGWRLLLRQRAMISPRRILAVARRHRRFAQITSWSSIIEAAAGGGVLYLLVSTYYSPTVVGYSYLTGRVLGRPLVLVASALVQVYMAEAGRLVHSDLVALRRRFWQVASRQLLLALVWGAVVNLAAGWAYPTLFGAQWAPAVPFVRPLTVALVAQTVLTSVGPTLLLLQRQGLAAAWQPVALVLLVGAIVGGWHAGFSALAVFWAYAAIQVLTSLVMLGMILVAIRARERNPGRSPTMQAPAAGPDAQPRLFVAEAATVEGDTPGAQIAADPAGEQTS